MTRLERGFYDGNGEFVTADERVECRFGGGRGTVNAIFQSGEAEVMFRRRGSASHRRPIGPAPSVRRSNRRRPSARWRSRLALGD